MTNHGSLGRPEQQCELEHPIRVVVDQARHHASEHRRLNDPHQPEYTPLAYP